MSLATNLPQTLQQCTSSKQTTLLPATMANTGFALAVLLFGVVCATYASPAPFPFNERDWQEQQKFTEFQDYPDGDGNMEVNTEQNNPMFQFDKERNQLVFISAAAEQASCTNLAVPTIIHGTLNIQICPERNNCGFVKVKLGRIVDTHVDICKPGLVQANFFLSFDAYSIVQGIIERLNQQIFALNLMVHIYSSLG